MEIKWLEEDHYTVERRAPDRWEVNKRGFDKAIASFSDKNDAMSYARSLAEMQGSAEVTVKED